MNHDSHSQLDITISEKVKGLPGLFGLQLEEQAPYDILKVDGGIEIRSYKPQTRASISVTGEFKEAYKEAFTGLAGYIFGNNKTSEKIRMTTPVLLQETASKEWTMSFILPQEFVAQNAPNPDDNRIHLEECPLHLVASISYAGINNEEKINEYTGILKKWLKKRPWYVPLSDFKTAQYDGPLTIPFFRKNEIHINVKHIH
nr:heme-binding protein [Bacteriovorax sp. HI3]